jgi:hypothetical protein
MNDKELIHEQYKKVLVEADEELLYNNSMKDGYIYPNKEEAKEAAVKFNDEFQNLMSKYGVHFTGDDSCSFEYVTTRYYDESGNIKEYELW